MRERSVVAAAVVVALLALAAHARVIACGFVNFDDPMLVAENPWLRAGLSPAMLRWAATTDLSGNWFPLTWASHALDVSLFGLAPAGHHATSLLLHALNSVLVLLVCRRAGGDQLRSALVAALFAVHPIHVETVAWISERKGVLAMSFGLLAILAWIGFVRDRRPVSRLAAIAATAASLASKPTFVSLPLLLLLLDVWPLRRREGEAAPGWGALVAEKTPFFVLAAASSVVTLLVQRPAMAGASDVPLALRLANAALAVTGYLRRFVWPVDLSVLYPYSLTPSWTRAALAVFVLAAITGALFVGRRRRPWLFVGWLWLLVALLPMLGLVQVGQQALADRYAYLPFLGLYAALAASIPGAWLAPGRRRAAGLVTTLLLGLLALASARRIDDWRDGVRLFEAALRVGPTNVIAMRHLGDALTRAGRPEDARAVYERALQLHPRFPQARHDLALVLVRLGRRHDAEEQLRQALALEPSSVDGSATLGALLAEDGRLEEARWHLQQALRFAPMRADAQRNLGLVLAKLGRDDEAEAALVRAAELEPSSADGHYLLGFVLASRARWAEAIEQFEHAVRLDPAHVEARASLERARRARAAAGASDGAVAPGAAGDAAAAPSGARNAH